MNNIKIGHHDLAKLYKDTLRESGSTDTSLKTYRFFSTFQLIQNAARNATPGAHFAECGCWKGHSALATCKILYENNFQKNFWVFDSFEGGLSEFKPQDTVGSPKAAQTQAEQQRRINHFKSSEEHVTQLLEPYDFVKIMPGWIPDRFPEVKDLRFQFVHIDVDLYEPTLEALKFFWPRVVPGGMIVIDDFNGDNYPGPQVAFKEYFENEKPWMFYEVPVGSAFMIKSPWV